MSAFDSVHPSVFDSVANQHPYELRQGIQARAINGQRLTMAVIDLEPKAISPEHRHDNEQLGFVIQGSITMRIGNEKKLLQAGETYAIPSNVPHDAIAGPDGATVVDVFAPVRADWTQLRRSDPSPGRWP
ncbi:MAG TPA: cupin domain-containing protein [Candidatus Dormibacteraeota bacterium]|nr:cupin domain-containing protein [Candidatus Dormibacteraeota bacterium]